MEENINLYFCHPDDAHDLMSDGNIDQIVSFLGIPRGMAIEIPASEFIDFVTDDRWNVFVRN